MTLLWWRLICNIPSTPVLPKNSQTALKKSGIFSLASVLPSTMLFPGNCILLSWVKHYFILPVSHWDPVQFRGEIQNWSWACGSKYLDLHFMLWLNELKASSSRKHFHVLLCTAFHHLHPEKWNRSWVFPIYSYFSYLVSLFQSNFHITFSPI